MTRIAIICHDSHTLFVEDISDEMLEKYNGEEEDYIKDNYCISGNFSWDYITSAQYIPDKKETEVYDIDFASLAE
jgi:predicted molibdopterin-dependent oxidoreductase YjgC